MEFLKIHLNDYYIKEFNLIPASNDIIPTDNITIEYILWRAYTDYQKYIVTDLKSYTKYASDIMHKYIVVDTIDTEIINKISSVYSDISDILYYFPKDLAILFSKSDFNIDDINSIIRKFNHNDITLIQDNIEILPDYIKPLTEYINNNRIFTCDITEEQTYKIIKGILREPLTATQNTKLAYLMFLLYKNGITVNNWAQTASKNNIFSRHVKKCLTTEIYSSYSHIADNSNNEIYIKMEEDINKILSHK